MLSPTRQQPPPDPDDHTSAVGSNENAQGSPSFLDAEEEDDDEDSTVSHHAATLSPSHGRRSTRTVLPAKDDPPVMGVMQMSRGGSLNVYVGGKPLSDWSGLDPSTESEITPNKHRGESHKEAKQYHYRTKGFDVKITPKDDIRETSRNVFDHLVYYGLDTIGYFNDPANPGTMEHIVEKPNKFSKEYIVTQILIYSGLYDRYDRENDACATKFFLDCLDAQLLRKLRDALANVTKPSFALTWMTFVEQNRVISVGRVDGLQKRVESRVPTSYPGQNLDTMAADNIRDINDLEQSMSIIAEL